MRTTLCRLALPLCLTVSCVLLSGCEDASSREASETSVTLNEQRTTLSQVANARVLPGAEQFDEMRQKLVSAASALDGIRAGTEGQQASAQLLASNAHRQIAQMDLADARLIGETVSRTTHEIFEQVSAYGRTLQSADSTEMFSNNLTRDHLDRERANWGARLRNAEERLQQLTEPIDTLESSNDEESDRVRALRDEANSLLRRAKELGQIEGQSTFETSVARRRDADRIEFDIANAEAELEYDLEPQKAWADMQAEGAQAIIETIDQAKREFDALENELQSRVVTDARAAAQELRDAIRSRQTELKALVDSRFQPSIDSAVEQADRAVSKAGGASTKSRGSEASTAKVAKAQAQAIKGEALWAKARIIGNQINLLQTILNAGDIAANASALQGEITQLTTMWDAAVSESKAAYAEAQSTLQNVGGNTGAEVNALNQSIGLTLRAIDGEAVDFSEIKTGGDSSMGSPRSGGGGGGADTLEGLVQSLASIRVGDPTGMDQMFNMIQAESAMARRALRAMRELATLMAEMEAATAKIDPSGALGGQISGAMAAADASMFDSVEIVEQDGNDGVVRLTAAGTGEVQELNARKVGSSWKLIVDDDSMDALGGPGSQMNSEDGIAMIEGMVDTFRSVLDKVNSGAISSPEEFMAAMAEAMMSGGGFGGAPQK